MATPQQTFIRELEESLEQDGRAEETMQAILRKILDAFDCVVGTVHRYNAETRFLELVSHTGVPDSLMERVTRIPVGKGMAGLAAERREPVQVCDLQTDESGVAKPRARETAMEGSIALPMLVAGELRGTLGVAKSVAHEYSADERDRLLEIGSVVGKYLGE